VTFSAEQVEELWDRWRRGEPSRLIARSLGCHATKVRRAVAPAGWDATASPASSGTAPIRPRALYFIAMWAPKIRGSLPTTSVRCPRLYRLESTAALKGEGCRH